jgi:phosphoglucomutase
VNESTVSVTTVACRPYKDQRPGTAGLRRKVAVFRQPHYLETFVQAVFDTLALPADATIVVGGDGRHFNDQAIVTILKMAMANGIGRIIVGRNGILSTPAASHLIRHRHAAAGFLLTASHNPGGPDGDFGIKFNMATGGQAPESVTEAVYQRSLGITAYRIGTLEPPDLDRIAVTAMGPMTVEIVDPAADYQALMESLFDFDRMRSWLAAGHRIRFDAMHGVTGPYARRILVETLGCPTDAILRGDPRPDFGGLHPDPNPVDGAALVAEAMAPGAPDLLAASDGDGDRNMILGPGRFLSPGDSVALMLAHIRRIPGYRDGVPGVARSMPTSRALDAVAARDGIPCYETPTGWRFFCNLLEDGRIGLCGEESFGTGSSHVREKDGLWAVLMWMNLLAVLDEPLPRIVDRHWAEFGRHHYQRRDYVIADAERADELMRALVALLPALRGSNPAGGLIETADEFTYRDPVDHSESRHQGIRLVMSDGTRIVYRLSGTGTSGATLRVYLERHVRDPDLIRLDTDAALDGLGTLAAQLARIRHHTGLDAPTARI